MDAVIIRLWARAVFVSLVSSEDPSSPLKPKLKPHIWPAYYRDAMG
jgi:hypothetical protein